MQTIAVWLTQSNEVEKVPINLLQLGHLGNNVKESDESRLQDLFGLTYETLLAYLWLNFDKRPINSYASIIQIWKATGSPQQVF